MSQQALSHTKDQIDYCARKLSLLSVLVSRGMSSESLVLERDQSDALSDELASLALQLMKASDQLLIE